jgi:hypothetical protein
VAGKLLLLLLLHGSEVGLWEFVVEAAVEHGVLMLQGKVVLLLLLQGTYWLLQRMLLLWRWRECWGCCRGCCGCWWRKEDVVAGEKHFVAVVRRGGGREIVYYGSQ